MIVTFSLGAGWNLVLLGFAAFVLRGVLARVGIGALGAWTAAIATGAATASAMAFLGLEAAWLYWAAAGLLWLLGFGVARSTSRVRAGFLEARDRVSRNGCRIGFFRPFHKSFSSQAKNLLLPLLQGYGTVFFVVDESFNESKFAGFWSKDLQLLPGLVGGHQYTNHEWQKKVLAQLDNLDIAVVDISVPSANVVWEIKQCYDRLPSHRIILVLCTASLPAAVPIDLERSEFRLRCGNISRPY